MTACSLARRCVRGLLGAVALAAIAAQPAYAQKYPDRPVKIVLPLAAGGVGDITARIVAERLSDRLGQRFVVENVPGPGGIAAGRAVLQAPADGYTLFLATGGVASSVPLYKQFPLDLLIDFAPVSSMGYFDCLMVSNAESQYRTLGDFLTDARAKPGALNIGTISAGGVQHLTATYFKQAAGIDVVIVPFRSTPDAIIALLRNDVQIVVDFYAALKSGITDNKLRPVAWTGPLPSPALPNIPTVKAQGVANFEIGIVEFDLCPRRNPPDIVATLNKTLRDVLAEPDIKTRLLDLGIDSKASTPADMDAQMRGDIKKWADVIDRAGIEKR